MYHAIIQWPPAAKLLNVWDKWDLAFHKEIIQLPLPAQCQTKKRKYYFMFPQINLAQQAVFHGCCLKPPGDFCVIIIMVLKGSIWDWLFNLMIYGISSFIEIEGINIILSNLVALRTKYVLTGILVQNLLPQYINNFVGWLVSQVSYNGTYHNLAQNY